MIPGEEGDRHERADLEGAQDGEVLRRASGLDEHPVRHREDDLAYSGAHDRRYAKGIIPQRRPPHDQLVRQRLGIGVRMDDRHSPHVIALAEIHYAPRAQVGEG